MNCTVFYSWQSDLPNKYNRSFIEDALDKAAKKFSCDSSFSIEAVIDRDTYGIPGSPSIVESITSKIARSDLFVCDVSIINNNGGGRPTPNPNVLFELGYASAILGWGRIIMTQNTAFGGIEQLPFDLRGRRILQYNVDDTTDDKAEERKNLKEQLAGIFADAFKFYAVRVLNTKEKIVWWGNWELPSKIKAKGGNLHISRVSSDAFFFHLDLFDGARLGEVAGKAQILTPHSAYARVKTPLEGDCEINFRRRLEGDIWHIDLEVGQACEGFHGANASFNGSYSHIPEAVVNWGYLDEIDLNEIERLTGPFLSIFMNNFQQIDAEDYTNDGELKVVTGSVKGMYTIMESIVVIGDNGNVWCAFLDPGGEVVRYFTNAIIEHQPKPMQEWLSRFAERSLVANVNWDKNQDPEL